MTDLFTISVDSVEGPTLLGRVHLINPDAWQISTSTTFPMALLVDAWFLLTNGFLADDDESVPRGDRYPFSREQGKQIVAGMRLNEEFSHLYDFLFGRMLRVDEAGYLLTPDGKKKLEPARKASDVYTLGSGSGHDEISQLSYTERDPKAFSQRAADIVTTYRTGPVHNIPLWSEVAALDDEYQPWEPGEEREEIATWEGPADLEYWRVWRVLETRPFDERPYADLAVTVKDPAYLEHMTAGMRWSTAHSGWL